MDTLENNISKLEHIALKVVQKVQQIEGERQNLNERIGGIVALFENSGIAEANPENELNSFSDTPTGGLLEYPEAQGGVDEQ